MHIIFNSGLFRDIELISKGAEAYIYRLNFFGRKAVAKVRVEKRYRDPKLDQYLRIHRTRREAKLLIDVKRLGVPAPLVYGFFPNEATIVLEFIEGSLLYSIFKKGLLAEETIKDIAAKLGAYVGRMHDNGIVHGDLTTSNIILQNEDNIVLIDFGLGDHTKSIEDFGTELRVLYNSLKSAHNEIAELFFSSFSEGYSEEFQDSDKVFKKLEEIAMRGRYVEERRKKKIFHKKRV